MSDDCFAQAHWRGEGRFLLVDVGFDAPELGDVARGHVDVERTFLHGVVWPELSAADRALFRSQCGPFAGIPFTCSPVVVESRLELQIFLVLLFRCLWCLLFLSAHFCRCGRPVDVRGHHRSVCGRARGVGLWQTVFFCSMARNSLWTQPWCLLSEEMGVLVASVLTTTEQLCSKHDVRRKTPTLSWPAHVVAERVWWFWVAK